MAKKRSRESKIRIRDNRKAQVLALLGMPFGTANYRLRKILLFHMAVRLGENICYRCQSLITSADEFSIEHKTPWQSATDPAQAFFDVSGISFSHILCNSRAASEAKRIYLSVKDREIAKWKRSNRKKAAKDKERRARLRAAKTGHTSLG